MSDELEFLPEVPDWIDEKVEYIDDRDVQDHHIVDAFLSSDGAWLSTRQLVDELENTITRQGLHPRLAELEEIDVLDSKAAAGGHVYWIRDERSEWPIPPDVRVEGTDDDALTVEELLSRPYAMPWVMAAIFSIVSSVLYSMFVGTLAVDSAPMWLTTWSFGLALIGTLGAIALLGIGLYRFSRIWYSGRGGGDGSESKPDPE